MTLRPFAFVILPLLVAGMSLVPAHAQQAAPLLPPDPLSGDALSDALGGPTLLTLHLHDVTPANAFAKIAKQIGQPIWIDDSKDDIWKDRRVTIDADGQPFWKVIAQIARTVGFSWNRRTGQDGYVVTPSVAVLRELKSPGVDVGPTRVVALEALRQQWVGSSFADTTEEVRENGDSLRLKFAVLPDPKLLLVKESGRFELGDSTSDDGGQLFPFRSTPNDGTRPLGIFSTAIWQLRTDLKLSPGPTPKTLDFGGKMRFTAVTRKDEWHIDNVLDARETNRDFVTSKGTVRLTFRRLLPEDNANTFPGRYTVELTTQLMNGTNSAAEKRFMDTINSFIAQESRLVDGKGNYLAFSSSMRGGGQSNVSVTFARTRTINGRDTTGNPDSYRVIIPLEMHEVALPFEFQELPLPQFPAEQRAQ